MTSDIMYEGMKYVALKEAFGLNDEEVADAVSRYLEEVKPTSVEDVADDWAYWSPGDIK